MLVDGPRDQLLAGAALAGDQDGDVLGGDPADRLEDLEHGGAAADDRVAAFLLGGRLGDDGGLAAQPRELQRLADDSSQVLGVERLDQVVVRPLLHRLDGMLRSRGRRDEHDRDAGVDLPDALVDLQPREVGEPEVEQDDVRRPLGDATDPLLAGAGHVNPVLRGPKTWFICARIKSGLSSTSSSWPMVHLGDRVDSHDRLSPLRRSGTVNEVTP